MIKSMEMGTHGWLKILGVVEQVGQPMVSHLVPSTNILTSLDEFFH